MCTDDVISNLNLLLLQEKPKSFSSSWIYGHSRSIYTYIWRHGKNELGHIDWDRVVCRLDKPLQKLWTQRRPKQAKPYYNIKEVRTILKNYQSKLYVFLSPLDKEDRLLQNIISIALVRMAQKGNVRARQKLIPLLMFLVDQWIEHCPRLYKWQGYRSDIYTELDRCIRCYRFTGTFTGYLFKTMEYAGRGLAPTYSLDAPIGDTDRRLIDRVIYDDETNQIRMY